MYKKSCLESDRAILSKGPTPFCNLLLMLKTEANAMCIGQESRCKKQLVSIASVVGLAAD